MRFGFARSFTKALRTQRRLTKLAETLLRPPRPKPRAKAARPKLDVTALFGSNPGRLVMKTFVPAKLSRHPPLVVVLHGCRQSPETIDAASGFSRLARAKGFVLLYPEQTKSNNPQNCFNWFRPSAVMHDRGELHSIKQMIEHACKRHQVERSRIYIVGLSAGAARAAALVANYPEIFAGAAFVAGMPVGSARDAMSALRAMNAGAATPPSGWGNRVTELSSGRRTFPRISVWHGSEDKVVNPMNADAIIQQWLEACRIDQTSERAQRKSWGSLRTWQREGKISLSLYTITGMGHGLPVKARAAGTALTSRDPFVLPAGISAPVELMRLWGLGDIS